MCLHDIMWWFVASFSMPLYPEDAYENNGEWSDEFVSIHCSFFGVIFEGRKKKTHRFSGFDANMRTSAGRNGVGRRGTTPHTVVVSHLATDDRRFDGYISGRIAVAANGH